MKHSEKDVKDQVIFCQVRCLFVPFNDTRLDHKTFSIEKWPTGGLLIGGGPGAVYELEGLILY